MKQEKEFLSTIEAQIIGSIMLIVGDAYALSIIDFIQEQTGRALGLGTVYKVLKTLTSYKLIEAEVLEGTPERGGRKKTVYHLTEKGFFIYEKYFRQMEKFKCALA